MSGGERGGGSGMVKPGDRIWAGATFGETKDGRPTATVDGHGFLVDHPALPAVARWLAMYGAETLIDLIDAGVFCFDEGGRIFLDDASRRDRLIEAGRELIDALTGGEGAGGD